MIGTPIEAPQPSVRSADGKHDIRLVALDNGNVALVVTRLSDGAIRVAAEVSPAEVSAWLDSTELVLAYAMGAEQGGGQ